MPIQHTSRYNWLDAMNSRQDVCRSVPWKYKPLARPGRYSFASSSVFYQWKAATAAAGIHSAHPSPQVHRMQLAEYQLDTKSLFTVRSSHLITRMTTVPCLNQYKDITEQMLKGFLEINSFLQHISIACYAERCISYDRFRLSVCLSVCHTLVSCQNYSTRIMGSSLEDSPMTVVSSWLTSARNS